MTDPSGYFDPAFPGRGIILPLEQMNDKQYAAFCADYYGHSQLFAPYFGKDADGNPIAPHGMSRYSLPKLHPDHE